MLFFGAREIEVAPREQLASIETPSERECVRVRERERERAARVKFIPLYARVEI